MPEEIKSEADKEIAEALKEFEAKSRAEEEEKDPEAAKASELPRMVRLVIKFSGGAIKTQRQAEYVLLGVVVLMLAVSFYMFFGGPKPAKTPSPIPSPMNINQS